jgi:hypothetical protein
VSGAFALVARVPAAESDSLEALLHQEIVPSIGASSSVADVNTYSVKDGREVIYVVSVTLRDPGPHSPNLAFEILANGRSFEAARELQAKVKRYFSVSPILAERRPDLSINRRSISLGVTKSGVPK